MTLALHHVITAPSRQAVIDLYNDLRETRLIAVRIGPEGAISWISYLTPDGEVAKATYYGDREH